MSRTVTRYGIVAVSAFMSYYLPTWVIIFVLLNVFRLKNNLRANVFVKTIRRDLKALYRYLKIVWLFRRFQRNNDTVPIVFEKLVKKHPDKACFIFEDKVWTFKMVNELSNQVAHVFEDAGFKAGDTVALLLDNRPEYVAIWLGLAKAGIITALINNNLKGDPLKHSIQIVDSKALIFGADFADVVSDVGHQLSPSIPLYAFDVAQSAPAWSKNFDALLDEASFGPLTGGQRCGSTDKMLYIYTSGTTGLPKAAIIRHSRYAFLVSSIHHMTQMNGEDIIYITLPLYHSAGGQSALGQNLLFGCTAVLRRKFSASAFWPEVSKHKCTTAIYIGEICRYLLATAPRPEDRDHRMRIMYGNGLRPQIWQEFVDRFNIPLVAELYGATEGIANVMNFEGVVGAVGSLSQIAPSVYPVALIQVDESGEPVRDENGLCIRCKPREPGMFIGLIDKSSAHRNFDGYADREATKKKITQNIFRHGDAAFLSGDILEMDELGYLFFKDRTGDTFRWRGENVSTAEVEAVISNVAGLKDCVVYGVEVPGAEGRAGMAAILDADRSLDLSALAEGMAKVLPAYARPLFIRIISTIEMTGTYKLQKMHYQKEGFDVERIEDEIYFLEPSAQKYVLLTSQLHDKINSGSLRI